MLAIGSPTFSTSMRTSTSCNALLRELQQIWNEIGESEAERERMLIDLERECLAVYQRKVEDAANSKARLHHSVAAKEAELATLMASLGELNIHSPMQKDKKTMSLKEKLASVSPLVDDLKMKKEERLKQFDDIKSQIEKISGEISGYSSVNNSLMSSLSLDEHDLSMRKLNEYQTHLRTLQKEKSDRLNKVFECVNEVHSLCSVLGLDFGKSVSEVHPSLHGANREQLTNISNSTLEGLEQTIQKLKSERKARIQKLKDIGASLLELWNLMDSSKADRNKFSKITSILCSSDSEIVEPGFLSMETVNKASMEVERLTKLKASRMKELVMKKIVELEEMCKMTHIEPDTSTSAEKSTALIDSGLVDPGELLANIDAQITKAKEQAMSRKEIMDRIDRWLAACEEENWLEDYELDNNKYSAGRGVHINLKRAEKARITVRLVSILEDYKMTRRHRQEEKRRFRDQKKIQDLLLTEKELMYGSKPSPRRTNSFRKPNGYRGNGSMTPTPRRNSVCGTPEPLTPRSYSGRSNGYFKEMRRLSTTPLNFVAISKEDTMSFASISGSEPGSPPHS
ncbi:65-kDa microtubule-associated protein 6 [Linum perenne]